MTFTVDDLLEQALEQAIDSVLGERCTWQEAQQVRKALANPNDEMSELLDDVHGALLEVLTQGVCEVINQELDSDGKETAA